MQRQVAPGPWPLSHTVRLYVRKLVYCLIKGRLKRNVRPKGHTRTFGLRCVCTHTYRGVGEGGVVVMAGVVVVVVVGMGR